MAEQRVENSYAPMLFIWERFCAPRSTRSSINLLIIHIRPTPPPPYAAAQQARSLSRQHAGEEQGQRPGGAPARSSYVSMTLTMPRNPVETRQPKLIQSVDRHTECVENRPMTLNNFTPREQLECKLGCQK
jgi:hypothetical protein